MAEAFAVVRTTSRRLLIELFALKQYPSVTIVRPDVILRA
jgi:hypothetical protein